MATRKPKVEIATKGTISHIFAQATAAVETKPADLYVSKKLTSSDVRVQAFYDGLKPAEIIAHSIAVDKLGTSYDVTRTHGFLRWCKANPSPK